MKKVQLLITTALMLATFFSLNYEVVISLI